MGTPSEDVLAERQRCIDLLEDALLGKIYVLDVTEARDVIARMKAGTR
jgi:hypothetical protein